MKLIKYFALVLVMITGQSMASGYGYGHGSKFQIRADAQRLINAERNLLRTVNFRYAGRSHAARNLRVLISKTVRLKNATYYRTNRFVLRNRMRNLRIQFRHTRRSIRMNFRLNRSPLVRVKVRRIARLMNRLQRDVYAFRGYRGYRGHRGHNHASIWF